MKRVSSCIKQKNPTAAYMETKGDTHTHTEWHTCLFNMADSTAFGWALRDVRGYGYSGCLPARLGSAFCSYLYSFVFRQASTTEAQQFQLTLTHKHTDMLSICARKHMHPQIFTHPVCLAKPCLSLICDPLKASCTAWQAFAHKHTHPKAKVPSC